MMRILRIFIIEGVRWVYWFPFRMLIQRIPLSWGYGLAWGISFPAAALLRRKARIVDEGLRILFGEKISTAERRSIVRKTFEGVYKTAIEVLWYPRLNEERCRKLFIYEGLQHLDNAIEERRGIVLLHGHLGNTQMLMPALGYRGYKLNQVASRVPPAKLKGPLMTVPNWIKRRCYDLKIEYKESFPVQYFYTDGSMKKVVKSIKNNGILAAAIDGREGSKWIEVAFLNQNAFILTGIMKLIRMSDPVVLPIFIIRRDDNRHQVIIRPPMEVQCTDDKDSDIRYNTENFLTLLEQYVIEYPSLYSDVYWLQQEFFLTGDSNHSPTREGKSIDGSDNVDSTTSG